MQQIGIAGCDRHVTQQEAIMRSLFQGAVRCRIPVFLFLALHGCAIQIQQPADNAIVPTPTAVVISGNAVYHNLKVLANGRDVTSQMTSQGGNAHSGSVSLPQGSNSLQASADVNCWFCTGGRTHSSVVRNFVVLSTNMFVDIDAGDAHTCAVAVDNRAVCWGDNSDGQLGIGTTADLSCNIAGGGAHPCRPHPTAVAGGLAFKTVSAGHHHSCGLTTAGEVFCWGGNDKGQLGVGTLASSRAPLKVTHTRPFVAVSAGGQHTCAVDDQMALFCWGSNSAGQLGVMGVALACPSGTATGCSALPIRQGTGTPAGSGLFLEVAAGSNFTCASNRSTVKCWGENDRGQLGIGQVGPGSSTANAALAVAGQYVSFATAAGTHFGPGIAAGSWHACALSSQGRGASCWGDNTSGELGGSWQGSAFGDPKTVAVPNGSGQLTAGIAAGEMHSCALWLALGATSRAPVCAGYNGKGQLGNGRTTGSTSFDRVSLPTGSPDFFKITSGGRHSCALSVAGNQGRAADGSDFFGAAFCWGDNAFGQVGQSFQDVWRTPTEVRIP